MEELEDSDLNGELGCGLEVVSRRLWVEGKDRGVGCDREVMEVESRRLQVTR